MIIKIPQNNRWTQANNGDLSGMIQMSRGIDLTINPGKIP